MNLCEQEHKSKSEIHRIYNSLSCLAISLVNQNILIDLRNETSVAGRIVNVDG
jgi:small nuclear ribonucleoprotein (snRNP)-like protein